MSITAPYLVWGAFLLVIWAIGLFFKRLSETLCVWAHRQWKRGAMDPDLPFSDDGDETIESSTCHLGFRRPPMTVRRSCPPLRIVLLQAPVLRCVQSLLPLYRQLTWAGMS
ncbi:hypothetical protein M758_UG048800 [Ceratodon purpureus]|nr:hypothetical protein M758_UG048800 [Ceratodon purpureus]